MVTRVSARAQTLQNSRIANSAKEKQRKLALSYCRESRGISYILEGVSVMARKARKLFIFWQGEQKCSPYFLDQHIYNGKSAGLTFIPGKTGKI